MFLGEVQPAFHQSLVPIAQHQLPPVRIERVEFLVPVVPASFSELFIVIEDEVVFVAESYAARVSLLVRILVDHRNLVLSEGVFALALHRICRGNQNVARLPLWTLCF